jgi:cobyrinic acid a,c-diamide synthase
MYLGSSLEDSNGDTWLMADIIPGHSKMGKRLTRFGYCAQAAANIVAAEGSAARA